MRTQSEISQDAFDKFLAWLNADREQARTKYETIRRKLIKIFICRGCQAGEELADQTINRVIRKLLGGGGHTLGLVLQRLVAQLRQRYQTQIFAVADWKLWLVTPTAVPKTDNDSIHKLEISDEFRAHFSKETDGQQFVAFVNTDCDRFFNQLYVGLRLQTFFFNRHNVPMQRFPAQLVIQFGLNSYLTGGRLNQGVLRLDGYYPVPYDKLKFISLFGTAIIRPAHAKITTPLILKERNDITIPASNVAIIPFSQFNRGYYKVGVAIDFISLVQKLNGK